MFGNPLRCCCHVKNISPNVFDISNNLKVFVVGLATQKASYSNKSGCCKDTPQSEGKTLEPWPRGDPPPPLWRAACPQDPQPPNYDPYRIKVPDVEVPPLPPAGAAKPMINCAKKGPCSGLPAPPPPPCPPIPPKPFPWIYVWITSAFFIASGLMWQYWLYRNRFQRGGIYTAIWQPRRKVKRPYHDKDLPACVQYLIIGAGAAGWSAHKSILEHDPTAKVFFISKEDMLPYQREPMSKFMWWNVKPPVAETLEYLVDGKRHTMFYEPCNYYIDPVKFYRKKTGPAVSVATGWCVLRLDTENHIAYIKTMCGERPMYYERCLLAVGSKPKNLSIFHTAPLAVRQKVTTFRTIRDLEIAYRKVKEAKHITIIGAGPLGCELAWHIGRMNSIVPREEGVPPIEVNLMYKDAGVLGNILPQYLGEWVAERIKCEGVNLIPYRTPHDAFISKDGRLELTLNDGSSYVTDYAFVCVGNVPRTEIAEPSFLEQDDINGGFVVNTELEARTHLYAAGDCASFYSQWKDARQRFEHYENACEQGHIAGANMTGYWLPCNIEPTYWIRLGAEFNIQIVGEVGACMPIVALFKPCTPEDLPNKKAVGDLPCYKDALEYHERYKRGLLCYIRDETIVGFIFWNMIPEMPAIEDRLAIATEILRARPSYKDINLVADLLGFPETHCMYISPEERIPPGPCISRYRELHEGRLKQD